MYLEFSRQIFEKYSNIKFHETPSIGSQVVSRGRTDGQADMTQLIVAFSNFANAPKNGLYFLFTRKVISQGPDY
jgi:hypothetical protein